MTLATHPQLHEQFTHVTKICAPCLFGGEAWDTLVLPVRQAARYVRVSLPGTQVLHLAGLDVYLSGDGHPFADYALSASSYHPRAHPEPVTDMSGGLHTDVDEEPFILLDLGEVRSIENLRLRNRRDVQATRNWKLRVHLSDEAREWSLLHDHQAFVNEAEKIARNAIFTVEDTALQGALSAYADCLFFWLRGHSITRKLIEDCCAAYGLDPLEARVVEKQLNQQVMFHYRREITGHGNHQSFRFWAEASIREYLTQAMAVCHDLQEISPYTCVGYGGVLSYVRDGALIPHDDDIDLIIGFKRSPETPTIAVALERTEAFLKDKGWKVSGDMLSHRWVNVWRDKNIDVFVGLIEDEHASFFPGPRKQILTEQVFPPMSGKLYGVDLLLPRNPFHYIEKVYGETWRTPQPGFAHVWSGADFTDVLK